MEELLSKYMARYSDKAKATIYDYWQLIRWTRRHGKVSDRIRLAEMEYKSR